MVWALGWSGGATMSAGRSSSDRPRSDRHLHVGEDRNRVGQFGDIAISQDGKVTISGTHCTGSQNGPCPIKVATDFNGLGAGGFRAPVTVVTSNVGTFTPIPAMDDRTIHAHPNQTYDIKTGRLYLTYTDRPATNSFDTDIYVQRSDNGGAAWNPPNQAERRRHRGQGRFL